MTNKYKYKHQSQNLFFFAKNRDNIVDLTDLKMMKKLLFILTLYIFSNFYTLYAQVVLPSLDPTNPVELAAAASWRFGSTVGGGGKWGTQKPDDEQVDINTLSNYGSVEPVHSEYIFAYQPSEVIFEISGITNEKEYTWDGSDNTTDHLTQYEASSTHLKVAIRGNNQVSVGIEYQVFNYKDASADAKTTVFGGSFGMRFLDNIFISGGLNRKTLKADELESDMKWQELISGIAFQFGSPDQNMFKAEGAIKIEDATEAKIKDSALSLYRRKTTTVQGNVEVLLSGLLLSYNYKNITYEKIDDLPLVKERTETRNRVGLGYRSPVIALVLYGETRIEKEDTNKYDTKYIGLNFSISFM